MCEFKQKMYNLKFVVTLPAHGGSIYKIALNYLPILLGYLRYNYGNQKLGKLKGFKFY